jgi:thymidine kinase
MPKLELILGPMFSSKSTAILNRIRKYKHINMPMLIVKNAIDTRYDPNKIVSHNGDTEDCFPMQKLMSIFDDNEMLGRYNNAHVIIIEEAQFFDDLLQFVERAFDVDKKNIIIGALNGDFKRKLFKSIAGVIPLATDIELTKGYCTICGKNNEVFDSIYSKRITNENNQILVGSNDAYVSVCHKHYLED